MHNKCYILILNNELSQVFELIIFHIFQVNQDISQIIFLAKMGWGKDLSEQERNRIIKEIAKGKTAREVGIMLGCHERTIG
jgi:hypothetical protein